MSGWIPPYWRLGEVRVSWKRREARSGRGEEMRATEVSSLEEGGQVLVRGGEGRRCGLPGCFDAEDGEEAVGWAAHRERAERSYPGVTEHLFW